MSNKGKEKEKDKQKEKDNVILQWIIEYAASNDMVGLLEGMLLMKIIFLYSFLYFHKSIFKNKALFK